jgi:hypothetical protein
MSETQQLLSEVMIITSLIIVLNIIGISVYTLSTQSVFSFVLLSNSLFLELAFLLVIGGCFMARQPIEDKKRFDESGNPVLVWKLAVWGKKIVITAVLMLIFAIVFALSAVFFQA